MAATLAAAGAVVQRGNLDDLESLRAEATESDGVIHPAYIHDSSRPDQAAHADRQAIETLGTALAGSDRPLVIASGVFGLAEGRPATERDVPQEDVHPRSANARAALAHATQGVRSSVVRLAPTVHGDGDYGFIAALIAIARQRGVSSYIADGSNRWPAAHRLDAAHLFRLAMETAPAGSVLHGVAEEGVLVREIAPVIGRHLNVPVASIAPENAEDHFGWLAHFLAADIPAFSTLTQERLGWWPTQPGLVADLNEGHYVQTPPAKPPATPIRRVRVDPRLVEYKAYEGGIRMVSPFVSFVSSRPSRFPCYPRGTAPVNAAASYCWRSAIRSTVTSGVG